MKDRGLKPMKRCTPAFRRHPEFMKPLVRVRLRTSLFMASETGGICCDNLFSEVGILVIMLAEDIGQGTVSDDVGLRDIA